MTELKLHIGCGPRILKGWVNIDLVYEPFANYLQYYTDIYYGESVRGNVSDFVALDVTKQALPFEDNSVDVIFHEDFIEHLSQIGQVIFLAETYRVLKFGAVHRINTPNLVTSMKEHSNFKLGMYGVYTEEWNKNHHINVMTPYALQEMGRMIGYSEVILQQRNKSMSNLIPLEYRPDPHDRPEYGNIFADLIK